MARSTLRLVGVLRAPTEHLVGSMWVGTVRNQSGAENPLCPVAPGGRWVAGSCTQPVYSFQYIGCDLYTAFSIQVVYNSSCALALVGAEISELEGQECSFFAWNTITSGSEVT